MLVKAVFAAVIAILLVAFTAFLFHRYSKGEADADPDGATIGHARSLLSSLFLLVFAIGIIVPWTTDDAARQNTYAEAQGLTEAYWSAGSLPSAAASQIKAGLKDYTTHVAVTEWPMMASGHLSEAGWKKLNTLRGQLSTMQFTSKDDQATQSDVLSQLRTVYQARRQREADATSGLPPAVLFFIVLTGVIMVAFPYLSGVRPHRMALVPLLVMSGLLGVSIFLIFNINHRFAGGLAVKPDAFISVLDEYQRTP